MIKGSYENCDQISGEVYANVEQYASADISFGARISLGNSHIDEGYEICKRVINIDNLKQPDIGQEVEAWGFLPYVSFLNMLDSIQEKRLKHQHTFEI